MIAAGAKLLAGHDEEAVARLNRSIELDPNEPMRHFHLAAALAHLGRMEERMRKRRAWGLSSIRASLSHGDRAAGPSDHPVFLANLERLHEGMRLAGVPEE